MAVRIPFSAALALLFVLGLASALSIFISKPVTVDVRDAVEIVFTRQIADTPVQVKPVEKPVPPPPVEAVPIPRIALAPGTPEAAPAPVYRAPTDIPRPGTGSVGSDRDPLPMVRVEPAYPPGALNRGTEGWVRVQFDVSATGAVVDPRVVEAKPRGVFDKAALQAVARWRYHPRVEGGQAVTRRGLQTVIRFDIEK